MEMDRHRRKQTAIMKQQQSSYSEGLFFFTFIDHPVRSVVCTEVSFFKTTCHFSEVSSKEWKFISMSEQEEDIINRMYKLVGPR